MPESLHFLNNNKNYICWKLANALHSKISHRVSLMLPLFLVPAKNHAVISAPDFIDNLRL